MTNELKIFSAPLQGYTDAPWRNFHNSIFGGIDTYYTPFLRIERHSFRSRDLHDIDKASNEVNHLVPQIIGTKDDETKLLIDKVLEKGYNEVDINLGCPFPLITGKHKGSGMLPYPSEIESLVKTLQSYSSAELSISIKMRLGFEDSSEAVKLLPILEDIKLSHITLHPRIGVQQYKGDVNLEAFDDFYQACNTPLVYNGDLLTVDDINRIIAKYPGLHGVMIGRGLLSYPSLAREYKGGTVATVNELMELHDALLAHYSAIRQGDNQVLMKMKTFWEYYMPELDRKIHKAIKKSSNMSKYNIAISNIARF